MSQLIGKTSLAYHRAWHSLSMKDQVLGKAASRIAVLLMGKHKPIYDPSTDCGDYVVVTDVRDVVVTGNKSAKKTYIRHTGYPGGLRKVVFKDMIERRPDYVLRQAVSGMLPKNQLRWPRLKRLRIFLDDQHPYQRNLTQRYDHGAPARLPPPPPMSPALAAKTLPTGVPIPLNATGRPFTQRPYGIPSDIRGTNRRGRYR